MVTNHISKFILNWSIEAVLKKGMFYSAPAQMT